MLVDGCCSIDCDWETMKKSHSLAHDEKMIGDRWLFLLPGGEEGQVLPAQVCHVSRHEKACRLSDPSVCSLQDCGEVSC